MNPSCCRTPSTRSRSLDAGVVTFDLPRSCALRMRASMSPIGSVKLICLFSFCVRRLPARLDQARDQALVAELAQSHARHLHFAVIGARTPSQLATIANTVW